MGVYTLDLNYPVIPILSTGFTRSKKFVGNNIRFCRGGFQAVTDEEFSNHAFLTTMIRNEKNKNCTEQTFGGLKQQSLEQYRYSDNRIVSMYYWTGWDDESRRNEALDYLAEIARKQGDKKCKEGKYDFKGLFTKIKYIGPLLVKYKIIMPDPVKEWCSETCASIHKKFGAPFISKVELAPDELAPIMKAAPSCRRIYNFYKYPQEIVAV